jgi:hypothetical protein
MSDNRYSVYPITAYGQGMPAFGFLGTDALPVYSFLLHLKAGIHLKFGS